MDEPAFTKSDLIRWIMSGVIVCAAGGAFAALALSGPSASEDSQAASAPIVEIDLQPMSVGAATTDLPDGPPRNEVQAAPAPPSVAIPPAVEPPPPQQDDPAVELPVHQPTVIVQKEEPPQDAVAPPSAPTASSVAAIMAPAPTPGELSKAQARLIASWQRSLLTRLEREKSYPQGARGASGVVTIAFTIDRQGHLLASHIVKSSGSAALDVATLALIARAQPFPLPPMDLTDDKLSLVVPVRYLRADAN